MFHLYKEKYNKIPSAEEIDFLGFLNIIRVFIIEIILIIAISILTIQVFSPVNSSTEYNVSVPKYQLQTNLINDEDLITQLNDNFENVLHFEPFIKKFIDEKFQNNSLIEAYLLSEESKLFNLKLISNHKLTKNQISELLTKLFVGNINEIINFKAKSKVKLEEDSQREISEKLKMLYYLKELAQDKPANSPESIKIITSVIDQEINLWPRGPYEVNRQKQIKILRNIVSSFEKDKQFQSLNIDIESIQQIKYIIKKLEADPSIPKRLRVLYLIEKLLKDRSKKSPELIEIITSLIDHDLSISSYGRYEAIRQKEITMLKDQITLLENYKRLFSLDIELKNENNVRVKSRFDTFMGFAFGVIISLFLILVLVLLKRKNA